MPHYLDHAASAPMRAVAVAAWLEAAAQAGNPSSLHAAGRSARAMVEDGRERIAACLGAHPSEVIFTSGGTEADNLALTGGYAARHGRDARRQRIVTSTVEHHAVLDPVKALAADHGALITWLEVDRAGRVEPASFTAAVEDDPENVAIASVIWANNEIGTIQPIAELAEIARAHGILMHSDAVQAVGAIPVDFAGSGLDLLSLSAHKFGGPVGIGALLVRREVTPRPLVFGGGQERGLRSGTVPAALVHAFAAALEEAGAEAAAGNHHEIALRDRLIAGVLESCHQAELTGPWTAGGAEDRLPGSVHFTVPGCESDSLLYLLDSAGIQCSTGSACQAGVPRPSHVVLALGLPDGESRGSIRFSLGPSTTQADVDAAVEAFPQAVIRAQSAGAMR